MHGLSLAFIMAPKRKASSVQANQRNKGKELLLLLINFFFSPCFDLRRNSSYDACQERINDVNRGPPVLYFYVQLLFECVFSNQEDVFIVI